MSSSIWNKEFWKAATERGLRGAVAALVGAYVAGNIVFDFTNISVTVGHVLGIALGGVVTSFGFSLVGNATTKSGPSLNNTETVK